VELRDGDDGENEVKVEVTRWARSRRRLDDIVVTKSIDGDVFNLQISVSDILSVS
jgi:hypothetical protein